MENILTDENFEKEIKNADKLVLVDFFATWCDPCSILAPILDKIAGEFKEKIILIKANLDAVPLIAQKFGIEQVPTVILFKNGKPLDGFIGLQPEESIREWLVGILYADYAGQNGFRLNPNKEVATKIIKGLIENERKYGKKYCPCRRVTGNEEEDLKRVCPCIYHKDEIEKNGHCSCNLFFK